jgi:hypothetical protein
VTLPVFADIADVAGMTAKVSSWGTAWGDYDNDGDQDVAISVGAQAGAGCHAMELYRNDSGNLVQIAEAAGVSDCVARGRPAGRSATIFSSPLTQPMSK